MADLFNRVQSNLLLLARSVRDPEIRRVVQGRYKFYVAGRLTENLTATHDDMTFLVDTRDRTIGRDTYIDGAYELGVMAQAMAILERALGPGWASGGTLVEVGANIGTSTVPALRKFGFERAVAIEPDPDNCRLLRANLELNDIRDRVRVIEAAASDANGTVQLGLCDVNRGDHRVVASGGIPVRSGRLDDLLQPDERAAARLLWMDTQGHEPLVLQGTQLVCPTVTELWPPVLRSAGHLDLFLELVAARYDRAIDVRTGLEVASSDIQRIVEVTERECEAELTDLVLLP